LEIVSNWSITAVDTASSSSDLVRNAAASGAPEGTGIIVATQSAGRGRRGANWKSPSGGMYFSLLLRPTFPVQQWFGLSFIAALAVRDELAALLADQEVGVKWPNDVLVGEGTARGKMSGILIEAVGDAVIIGTGVNIAPVDTPDGAKQPAVALNDFGGDITAIDLARRYQANLAARYAHYTAHGFAPVREEWLDVCVHRRSEAANRLTVHGGDGAITGKFEDLAADGAMVLLDDDGQKHHISTGDVELIGSL